MKLSAFTATMQAIKDVFGGKAFRTLRDGKESSNLNRALYTPSASVLPLLTVSKRVPKLTLCRRPTPETSKLRVSESLSGVLRLTGCGCMDE